MNTIAVSRTILLQVTMYCSQNDPKLVSDSHLHNICLSDRLILHLLGLVLFQIVTKDLHGDIRSRIEHVNEYFEHHAIFEVKIHLHHLLIFHWNIYLIFLVYQHFQFLHGIVLVFIRVEAIAVISKS